MAITGTRLPAARNAYRGIEFTPVALKLGDVSANVQVRSREKLKVKFNFFGVSYAYLLFPHGRFRNGVFEVVYYNAYNVRNGRAEYVVGPDRVEDFQSNGATLAWAAGLFYGIGKEAHPSAVEIVVAQRHAQHGRPMLAMKAQFRAVGKMWKDPIMVMGAAADVAAIGAVKGAIPKPKPRLRPNPRPAPRPLPPPAKACTLPPTQPKMRVVSPVYRISGRDIVVVESWIGRKAFYRSSGKNSGKPGSWLPVDEIYPHNGWFNKKSYVKKEGLEKGSSMYRYGTDELRRISDELGQMNIPRGAQAPPGVDEGAAVTLNRIMDFFGVERTKTTVFRPVPDD